MTSACQQQIFALDAKFNAHRVKNQPNFRTLYIRRRNQLLREFSNIKDFNFWKQYMKIRSSLLYARYGVSLDQVSLRRQSITTRISPDSPSIVSVNDTRNAVQTTSRSGVVPTKEADASRAIVGGNTIAENYAFVGVHHIFDQHTAAVTMVKFANNDRARLCCISNDSTVSICNVLERPPKVECVLKGHENAVTGCDWSAANDLLVTCSLDGQICLWDTVSYKCLRSVKDTSPSQLMSCLFHPVNNNIVVAGNCRGQVEVVNISTGMKQHYTVGGKVLSLAFESSGELLWAGNDHGVILSFKFNLKSGKLNKCQRIYLGEDAAITSINWRQWISREARDPTLLVNVSANSVRLYRVVGRTGSLELKRRFANKHKIPDYYIRSTFCPIMSFRQGACIVTGSEDSNVYFMDILAEKESQVIVNKLQGHSSPVLGVSFNYDESLLSTSDYQGLVIIWTREIQRPH